MVEGAAHAVPAQAAQRRPQTNGTTMTEATVTIESQEALRAAVVLVPLADALSDLDATADDAGAAIPGDAPPSAASADEAIPRVEASKSGVLTWGEDSPKGGRVVMNRALRDDAPVPLVFAQLIVQSMRDVGYNSTTSALCEHVDNAIGAGARNVRVYVRQTGKRGDLSTDVAVHDDGAGMAPQTLKVVTSFGGSTNFNNRHGIGRFGMGMKTAGLSMSPTVEITSWQERGAYHRMTLDTEAIGRDRSNVIMLPDPEYLSEVGADLALMMSEPMRYPKDASAQKLLAPRGTDLVDALGNSGTIVRMPDCDRLSFKEDRTLVDNATKVLAHVYRRFLDGGLRIFVNNREVLAVDPTMHSPTARHAGHEALRDCETRTSRLVMKKVVSVYAQAGDMKAFDMTVRVYALPIRDWRFTRKTLNAIGVFSDHTFSILRNDREVFLGSFPGILKRHSDLGWIRVEVDFPGELDEAFGVAANKQGVRLREDVSDRIRDSIKEAVATIRDDIHEIQARNAIERRASKPSEAEVKANEAEPFQAHALDVDMTDAERADMERNLRGLAVGLRRDGETEDEAYARILASKYVINFKNDKYWPFYDVEHRFGRVILTINTASPFYQKLYGPLADMSLKAAKQEGAEGADGDEADEVPGSGQFAQALDQLLLSLARTQSVMGRSREARPAADVFDDMRREWSDVLRKMVA